MLSRQGAHHRRPQRPAGGHPWGPRCLGKGLQLAPPLATPSLGVVGRPLPAARPSYGARHHAGEALAFGVLMVKFTAKLLVSFDLSIEPAITAETSLPLAYSW